MGGNNPQNIAPHRYRKGAEKARENGRKGGIASGVAKRERRTLRELAEAMRDVEPPKQARKVGGVDCDTYGAAAVAAMFAEAVAGNVAAFRALSDVLGEIQIEPRIDFVAPILLGTIPQAEVDRAKAAKAARLEADARERAFR